MIFIIIYITTYTITASINDTRPTPINFIKLNTLKFIKFIIINKIYILINNTGFQIDNIITSFKYWLCRNPICLKDFFKAFLLV